MGLIIWREGNDGPGPVGRPRLIGAAPGGDEYMVGWDGEKLMQRGHTSAAPWVARAPGGEIREGFDDPQHAVDWCEADAERRRKLAENIATARFAAGGRLGRLKIRRK